VAVSSIVTLAVNLPTSFDGARCLYDAASCSTAVNFLQIDARQQSCSQCSSKRPAWPNGLKLIRVTDHQQRSARQAAVAAETKQNAVCTGLCSEDLTFVLITYGC
jgi:hypothetical protein